VTLARQIFSDLVEKRLWPVAVALAIALIAIPVGLSKSPSEHAATGSTRNSPLAGEWSKLLGEATPVVSLAADRSTPTFRKRLARLHSKNPFIQQAIIKAKTQAADSSTSSAAPGIGAPAPVAPVSLPDTTTTSPSTGTGSQPTQPSEPQQFNYTATVSFGLEGKVSKKTLLLTDPLPNADSPIVAFMGASDGGKKAVFVVFAGASPRGVGECKPSADKCNFLYLKKGDVELFDVTGTDGSVTTYELDLEKIGVKTVSSSAAHSSKRHRRPASSAGKLTASPAR
jgi:hypothetical protein